VFRSIKVPGFVYRQQKNLGLLRRQKKGGGERGGGVQMKRNYYSKNTEQRRLPGYRGSEDEVLGVRSLIEVKTGAREEH